MTSAALRRTGAALLFVFLVAAQCALAAPRVEREISYSFSPGDPALRRRQSFDLYLPKVKQPPLVVFIHGGFWVESDDTYGIGPRLAEVLAEDGAAVALVRYRLSPGVRHPTHVRDAAAALATLKRLAGIYGYDPKRVYLIGHSAGATIAAQLALDPRHLADVGMRPSDLSGVVLLSGVYDLTSTGPMDARYEQFVRAAFGIDPAVRRAASPITHAGKAAPMLVLVGGNDLPGFAVDARRFVNRLRERGNRTVEALIVPGADSFRIASLRDDELVHALIDDFVGLRRVDPQIVEALHLRQRWHAPPFSTEPFWHAGVPVRSYPVDRRLRAALIDIFGRDAYEFTAYPLERYYAIDLLAYLDSQTERVGRGDYLTLTNVRGEKLYYSRSAIAPYRPVLVVGLDDEHNLFRIALMYHNKLEYSWRKEVPPIMARPLGAFLYFLKEPPTALRPSTLAGSGLTAQSFRLTAVDPLATLADLPQTVRDVLERRNTCLSCHSFRGVGARSGHITAANGKLHGGFALALEEYSPAVWRQFMFDQTTSANLIGVNPNPVEGPAAQALYDSVVAERSRPR
ncbi:MAG TPA: alpha/beta hydrolase [Burkholderiales bacterium]